MFDELEPALVGWFTHRGNASSSLVDPCRIWRPLLNAWDHGTDGTDGTDAGEKLVTFTWKTWENPGK